MQNRGTDTEAVARSLHERGNEGYGARNSDLRPSQNRSPQTTRCSAASAHIGNRCHRCVRSEREPANRAVKEGRDVGRCAGVASDDCFTTRDRVRIEPACSIQSERDDALSIPPPSRTVHSSLMPPAPRFHNMKPARSPGPLKFGNVDGPQTPFHFGNKDLCPFIENRVMIPA